MISLSRRCLNILNRKGARLFHVSVLAVALQGCINTVLEVSMDQVRDCSTCCMGPNRLMGAGIDWWSGEKTCTCRDGLRCRFDPKEDLEYQRYKEES